MNIMRSPKKHFSPSKKTIVITGSVVVILVIATVIVAVHIRSSEATRKAAVDAPTYATVLPSGKTIKSLGGWHKISPPDLAAVYAYTDNIDGISIDVSEQSLPDSFKSDTAAQVANIAKNYNATTKIVANETDAYIGTSAAGPQSVIFTKNNVLILIKSQKKIENESWMRYISTLQ